ncbi:Sec-independent protein translocase protein TatB [Halopseudomonas xiamenensis]|uniref:Sec-independent protein translocase protein TatB n=1 Tax=Halopseudomonas xiamenensis TaxID=157792 RepID=UPI001627C138|nr:Sec-independent protein translocase protein TatB [Halopseudomonas xiamenensis]
MFDIGFLEMVLVAIVALLVLGPERLPGAVRMAGLYIGRIKRSLADVRSQVEREMGADEIRQALHNEKIMADLAKKPGTAKPASNVKRASQGEDAEQATAPSQAPAVQSTDAPTATDDATVPAASPAPSSTDDHPAAPK